MARIDVGLLFSARDRLSGTLRRVNQGLKKTEKQAIRTRKGLRSIDLVIGLMVAGSMTLMIKKFVQMGAEMESLRVRIGVFERGMGNVDSIMGEVNEQFGKTPFSLKVIGDSFVRLKASGIDPLDGSLKSLIDAVAAFGGGSSELLRAGIAIQQMAGKGVVSMEEMRQQLGEAIPFAMRVMAQQMKISVGELIARIESGGLSAAEGFEALFGGFAATFDGVAEAMVNTMSGALQFVVKAVQGSADKIFNSFNIGTQIAVILQDIGAAIQEFTSNLSREDVQNFFNSVIEVGTAVVEITIELAKVFGVIVLGISKVINAIGGEASAILAAGVIGALVFGPVGALAAMATTAIALIVANFDVIERKTKELADKVKDIFPDDPKEFVGPFGSGPLPGVDLAQMRENGQKVIEEQDRQMSVLEQRAIEAKKKIDEAFKKTQPVLDAIGLSPENLKRLKRVREGIDSVAASLKAAETLPFIQKIERLQKKMAEFDTGLDAERERLLVFRKTLAEAFETGGASEDDIVRLITKITSLTEAIAAGDKAARTFGAGIAGLEGQLQANFLDKITDRIDKMVLKVKQFKAEFSGTELQQALAGIETKFGTMRIELEKQAKLIERAPRDTARRREELERVVATIQEVNAAEAIALAQARAINEAKQATLRLQDQQFANQIKFQNATASIDLQKLTDPLASIFSSDFLDRARTQREQLRVQIEETGVQISQLREQAEVEKDPERLAAINARITALKGTLPVLDQIKEKTTATALLSQELWGKVGDVIKTSLTDALVGLVQGTKTLQDVATTAFNKITEAAAEYLIQLLLIKAAGAASGFGAPGAGGGALGGGLLAGLFAKGGTFKGGVKPFASGDIIRGPTLFGLAGEAGTEAIMPLTRRNGRLGVEGGGRGDEMTFNIQALDTRQATEIIIETLPEIESARKLGQALNEGKR